MTLARGGRIIRRGNGYGMKDNGRRRNKRQWKLNRIERNRMEDIGIEGN